MLIDLCSLLILTNCSLTDVSKYEIMERCHKSERNITTNLSPKRVSFYGVFDELKYNNF